MRRGGMGAPDKLRSTPPNSHLGHAWVEISSGRDVCNIIYDLGDPWGPPLLQYHFNLR